MPTKKVALQKTAPKPVYVSQTYSVDGFFTLCQSHVVELVFHPRGDLNKYKSVTRRMLCTLNKTLLNSEFGKKTLNFKPPMQSPPYNAKAKGLVTVWDIFRQDWRNVPVKAAYIMPSPYTMKAEPVENFIDYFDKVIKPMTLAQRIQYIND
jgi:hypothetical protein